MAEIERYLSFVSLVFLPLLLFFILHKIKYIHLCFKNISRRPGRGGRGGEGGDEEDRSRWMVR